MGKQPKPWVAELGWAGIFLAFFVLNEYYETTPPEPKWASFPELPPREAYSYDAPPYPRRFQRRSFSAQTNREPRSRPQVASDTVTSSWLEVQGWPDWKAEGFVRDRTRWGGVDSQRLRRWDDRDDFNWILHAPEPMDLNTVPEELLYQHPLWRSVQVRALHRFRSKVRPLRSMAEVFALAPFDSIQQLEIPKYFYVKN